MAPTLALGMSPLMAYFVVKERGFIVATLFDLQIWELASLQVRWVLYCTKKVGGVAMTGAGFPAAKEKIV